MRHTSELHLSHADLLACFHYDPHSGVFTPLAEGRSAGVIDTTGYWRITIKRRRYLAHRLAWFYVHGRWPTVVDHKNRIRTDNRISNLRECSHSENNANKRHYGKSGFKGVYFNPKSGRYYSTIRRGGRAQYLGTFATPEEAYETYKSRAANFHGAFTCLR